MHNGTAIWDGRVVDAALVNTRVTWYVDFADSPTEKKNAQFNIAVGDNAFAVAGRLSPAWNNNRPANQYHQARQSGVKVKFRGPSFDTEIVGMSFTLEDPPDPDRATRVPGDGTEIKVVEGLYVHRSE